MGGQLALAMDSAVLGAFAKALDTPIQSRACTGPVVQSQLRVCTSTLLLECSLHMGRPQFSSSIMLCDSTCMAGLTRMAMSPLSLTEAITNLRYCYHCSNGFHQPALSFALFHSCMRRGVLDLAFSCLESQALQINR